MIPTSLFIAMLCILVGMVLYVLHVTEYIQRIFMGLLTTTWAFVLASEIVSGNVHHITSAGSSAVQVAPLSYILLFIAVVMALVTVIATIQFVQVTIADANR